MRAATSIRNSVLSQAKIIDDLLDMSRVRTGKLSLSTAPVLLGDVVTRLVEAERAAPVAHDVTLHLVNEAHGVYVLADVVRIEQVVMNLLSNAVKFTPAGGRIDVRLMRDDRALRLDVLDNGQGIAPEFMPRVFDMYGQSLSVTTRSTGGLGIGLALVREIVSLHGGRVAAFSDGIGKGACFSVWLPLLDSDIAPRAGAGGDMATSMAGLRILVVDDMEDMLTVFKSLLEMQGAIVFAATGAADGLAILASEAIDLLITDISMPDIDGYEFLRRIRLDATLAGLPVIAVTGLQRETEHSRSRLANFSAQMGKPVSIDRLNAIVRELLPRS